MSQMGQISQLETEIRSEAASSAQERPSRDEHHGHDPDKVAADVRHRPSGFAVVGIVVVFAAGFGALAYRGVILRSQQTSLRDQTAKEAADAPIRVLIVRAEMAPSVVEQILPGSAVPFLEAAIYARTNGYLKRWLVDIGDRVKENQLLAEIDTPEIDAQLRQARATLNGAKAELERNRANLALAKVNFERSKRLLLTSAVAQQDYDDAAAKLRVEEANLNLSDAAIKANESSVKRLEELQRFEKITAPFAGVVTARNYDQGALILADNASQKQLFHLSNIDTLRVFADVPQAFAASIKTGQPAPVFRREEPRREYAGYVARTTNSVDPATRTLRVEVDVPNEKGLLLPGMYLQVRFRLQTASGVIRVPGAAVITRSDGNKVALVDDKSRLIYRKIDVGRDFGTVVEVLSGLEGGETVVLRPGDDLPEGTLVEIHANSEPG